MMNIRVSGVEHVLNNLRLARGKIGGGLERGLNSAAHYLMRESLKIVPVQTGNLKGSWFVRKFGSGLCTDIIVGYTADYAAYVHEDLTKAHGREFNIKHAAKIAHARKRHLKAATAQGGMFERGENQQAKFLEQPAREHRDDLLRMIRDGTYGIK